jgi:hypothetical protein
MEVKIIKYKITQDFEKLLAEKDCQYQAKEKAKKEEFRANRERLLPYVLQMIESAYTVHNMRCKNTLNSTTGKEGIFGLNKVDIQKKINYILREDCNGWYGNGSGFVWYFGGSKTNIWLNDRRGAHVATPNLEYSMTVIRKWGDNIDNIYVKSIEKEIENLINILAENYHDEW